MASLIENLTRAAQWIFHDLGVIGWVALFFVLGCVAGHGVRRTVDAHSSPTTGAARLFLPLGTGAMFVGFVAAYVQFHCQETSEVRPDEIWYFGRVLYQLALITLLIAATGIDFRTYFIPDSITVPGMAIGVLGAALSGDLQIVHLWVDWNQEIPGLAGPFIPDWIKEYRHWHGLAWSLAGLGDVTLMAMIGSFIGWQPVIFVFLAAPLCGLVMGLFIRILTGKTFVPYGPYLSLATLLVLVAWRWLWEFGFHLGERDNSFSIRKIFGDWPSLLILLGICLGGLIVLLGLLRLYRMIPGKRAERAKSTESE